MSTRTILIPALITALNLGLASPLQANDNSANNAYQQTNLVSGGLTPPPLPNAPNKDSNLVNAWGIAFNPNGFVWVANAATGTSTLYDGDGTPSPKPPLVVTVPPPKNATPPSAPTGIPTGIVFSSGTDFIVTKGGVPGPSRFIFATEDGTLSAWAPNVDSTNAILQVDNSGSGAIYKGLALAANGGGHYLYATDFHNNKIDVFDATFAPVPLSSSTFSNFSDPKLPQGYAPFGIQNINGNLYVTYAKQDAGAEDDVAGRGFGFVNVFDANGNLIRRFASRGSLNAPWGLALAPADFGRFSNTLLVGNFGDGRINAYDLATGEFRGQLRQANSRPIQPIQPIQIDGLWGLSFGNGVQKQPTNVLFFTAGPNDETQGLYGRIKAVSGNARVSNDDLGDD
jgi:uncharacterized protein (TIGR03118 family)